MVYNIQFSGLINFEWALIIESDPSRQKKKKNESIRQFITLLSHTAS
jgi:hypothetical protein